MIFYCRFFQKSVRFAGADKKGRIELSKWRNVTLNFGCRPNSMHFARGVRVSHVHSYAVPRKCFCDGACVGICASKNSENVRKIVIDGWLFTLAHCVVRKKKLWRCSVSRRRPRIKKKSLFLVAATSVYELIYVTRTRVPVRHFTHIVHTTSAPECKRNRTSPFSGHPLHGDRLRIQNNITNSRRFYEQFLSKIIESIEHQKYHNSSQTRILQWKWNEKYSHTAYVLRAIVVKRSERNWTVTFNRDEQRKKKQK